MLKKKKRACCPSHYYIDVAKAYRNASRQILMLFLTADRTRLHRGLHIPIERTGKKQEGGNGERCTVCHAQLKGGNTGLYNN